MSIALINTLNDSRNQCWNNIYSSANTNGQKVGYWIKHKVLSVVDAVAFPSAAAVGGVAFFIFSIPVGMIGACLNLLNFYPDFSGHGFKVLEFSYLSLYYLGSTACEVTYDGFYLIYQLLNQTFRALRATASFFNLTHTFERIAQCIFEKLTIFCAHLFNSIDKAIQDEPRSSWKSIELPGFSELEKATRKSGTFFDRTYTKIGVHTLLTPFNVVANSAVGVTSLAASFVAFVAFSLKVTLYTSNIIDRIPVPTYAGRLNQIAVKSAVNAVKDITLFTVVDPIMFLYLLADSCGLITVARRVCEAVVIIFVSIIR